VDAGITDSKAAGQVSNQRLCLRPHNVPSNPQHAGLLSRQSVNEFRAPHRRHKSPVKIERVGPARLFCGCL